MIPERPGKNVGRGTPAPRSPVSSRLTGSKPGTSTEWRWPLSRTKLAWSTLREYHSCNELYATLVLSSSGPELLLNMHVLQYCSTPIAVFL